MRWTETIVLPSGEKSPAFPIRPRPIPVGWFVFYGSQDGIATWRVARFRVTRRWRMA